MSGAGISPDVPFTIRDPTLGDGLVLNRTSDGGFVLHVIGGGPPSELGRFERVADAWTAVDELDQATAAA